MSLSKEEINKVILKKYQFTLVILFTIGMLMSLSIAVYIETKKATYIDSLKGNNPYKENIVKTIVNDSIVSVDTIYVKINEKKETNKKRN